MIPCLVAVWIIAIIASQPLPLWAQIVMPLLSGYLWATGWEKRNAK